MLKKTQARSRQKKIASRSHQKSHQTEAKSEVQMTIALGDPSRNHSVKKKSKMKRTSCENKTEVTKSIKTLDRQEQDSDGHGKTQSMVGSPIIWCLQTLERGAENIGMEFKTGKAPPADKIQMHLTNLDANRYGNQVCLDETRVKVAGTDNDYINANYVTLSSKRAKQYICTQGPLDKTIEQFWRMVWNEDISCIVMLCECYEGRQQKCANYWPTELNTSLTFGIFTIKNRGSSLEFDSTVVLTLLEVKMESSTRTLKHLQYKNWPDQGVPSEAATPHRLLRYIDSAKTVIHCSAGVGRTATLLLVIAAIQMLRRGQLLEMPALLEKIREQRAGAVQNDMQYIYCHLAVLDYYKEQLDKEKVAKFGKDLEAILNERKAKKRQQRKRSQ